MKKLIIVLLPLVSGISYSQMGIQTDRPRQVLHVDGQKNTPVTGSPNLVQTVDDFVVTNDGKVGIRNIEPEKVLDIEANNDALRLRNLAVLSEFSTSSGSEIITRNPANGDLQALKLLFSMSASIAPNTSNDYEVDASNNITKGLVNVYMGNECGRTMMSQLAFNGSSMFFLGGMGRDVIGEGSILDTGNVNNPNESVLWRVVFPSVLGCADGGNSNQFNFDFQKIGPTTFRVTSRSNINKIIFLSIERL